MVFNSIPFAAFFAVFFILYWFIFERNLKLQNLLLLAGSYLFYCWWDWRFLSLLIGSTVINYYLGISISKTENNKKRKLYLYTGLILGLGGLLFFKYYNFFITSFIDAFGVFNIRLNFHTLQLILPLGISFYTFRTISYLLDIDKNKIKPVKDWVVFFSYVSFFPSLISGPIDKAKLLVPQLENKRQFNHNGMTDGMRQILWGLFKKIVVADNCADVANQIFGNYHNLPASTLLLGALFYTFQLYADFSGYSDMAIGFARLLGFNITRNFNYPFFAQNIADYWRRWHMSLTGWLTEYVFTPLSIKFRDYGKPGLAIAITINLIICGLWHGANWTYVLFGFLHGCYFIPLIIKGTMNKTKKNVKATLLPSFTEFRNMVATFSIVMLTNIIFRADNIMHAGDYYKHMFSLSFFSNPVVVNKTNTFIFLLFSMFMFFVEWVGRLQPYGIAAIGLKWPKILRWSFYSFIIFLMAMYMSSSGSAFIYFQF
jgi:alginate O-acetyltransferase complex protein AlgI